MAELHEAARVGERQGAVGRVAWHDPHRGPLGARRQPPRPRLQRRTPEPRGTPLLHQLGLAPLRAPQRHGERGLWGVPSPGRRLNMTTERAVLAGGCFWGVQDLFRRLPGVTETRVGYTGGNTPNATYRNHGYHAEGVEIL